MNSDVCWNIAANNFDSCFISKASIITIYQSPLNLLHILEPNIQWGFNAIEFFSKLTLYWLSCECFDIIIMICSTILWCLTMLLQEKMHVVFCHRAHSSCTLQKQSSEHWAVVCQLITAISGEGRTLSLQHTIRTFSITIPTFSLSLLVI